MEDNIRYRYLASVIEFVTKVQYAAELSMSRTEHPEYDSDKVLLH